MKMEIEEKYEKAKTEYENFISTSSLLLQATPNDLSDNYMKCYYEKLEFDKKYDEMIKNFNFTEKKMNVKGKINEEEKNKDSNSSEKSNQYDSTNDTSYEERKVIGQTVDGNDILESRHKQLESESLSKEFDKEINVASEELKEETKEETTGNFSNGENNTINNIPPSHVGGFAENYMNLSYDERLKKASEEKQSIFKDESRFNNTREVEEKITIGEGANKREVMVTRTVTPSLYASINKKTSTETSQEELNENISKIKFETTKKIIKGIKDASFGLIQKGKDKIKAKKVMKNPESEEMSNVK